MRILLVEDQKEKSDDVIIFLRNALEKSADINVRQSLRSGLKEIVCNGTYDLILLDMSMPNFDPGPDDPVGGTPESFAGREFLAQMDLRGIFTPVIIVTQYATFAKGQIELKELDSFFKAEYSSFYLGSIYYSSADKAWQKKLENLLIGIVK
ncbi:hypothetical protein [Halomonas sp. SpR8]|uniref:hypothetical protein n=1 Tax=Halomonas sp. SpR8 TaxID=3050463 RepID=UPI0027E465B7|nr:hypothetical protein [Halomonas sp. SpR8]MDQ7727917.1 hypothetical protein [Halomonas sp. SpR8]